MAIKQYSLATEGDKRVTEHFQVKEFACHDGSDYVPIDIDNDEKLTASDALKILQAAVGLT